MIIKRCGGTTSKMRSLLTRFVGAHYMDLRPLTVNSVTKDANENPNHPAFVGQLSVLCWFESFVLRKTMTTQEKESKTQPKELTLSRTASQTNRRIPFNRESRHEEILSDGNLS